VESAVAALIPALAALAATAWPRMPDDLRRAIRYWFVPGTEARRSAVAAIAHRLLAWRAEAGEQNFVLRYTPPHLSLGLALALLALPLLAVARSARLAS
jgi:hypothetical protein